MSTFNVIQIHVEGFDKNFSYLMVDEATTEAALVDPCGEIDRVFDEIGQRNLKLTSILITHTHFDHHDKLDVVLEKYALPAQSEERSRERAKVRSKKESLVHVYVHENGKNQLGVPENLLRYIAVSDSIKLGGSVIETFYTPGHHDDCVCYFINKENAADGIPKLITGDTLFVEGCGRTTSAGVEDLYESLQFLKTFPDETEVYSGHDYGSEPVSTIGREKQNNKYFLAKNFEEFRSIRLSCR